MFFFYRGRGGSSNRDVSTTGWVKPASDFVVTFHSNFFILLGADVSHNTAIATWKPGVRAPGLRTSLKRLTEINSVSEPLTAQVNVIVVTKVVAGVELLRQTLRTMRPVWLEADFASLWAKRCCTRRQSLNEDTVHFGFTSSRWFGHYNPFC